MKCLVSSVDCTVLFRFFIGGKCLDRSTFLIVNQKKHLLISSPKRCVHTILSFFKWMTELRPWRLVCLGFFSLSRLHMPNQIEPIAHSSYILITSIFSLFLFLLLRFFVVVSFRSFVFRYGYRRICHLFFDRNKNRQNKLGVVVECHLSFSLFMCDLKTQ